MRIRTATRYIDIGLRGITVLDLAKMRGNSKLLGQVQGEFNKFLGPEQHPVKTIRAAGGIRVFRDMMEDTMCSAASQTRAMAVLHPGYQIVQGDSDKREAAAARDYVEWNFRRLTGSFRAVERAILKAGDDGYSLQEIEWGRCEDEPWRGLYALKAIHQRDPLHYGFKRDNAGRMEGIVPSHWYPGRVADRPKKGSAWPIEGHWVVYSFQKQHVYGSPYGYSYFVPAYPYWCARPITLRLYANFVARVASGFPIIKYREGESPDRDEFFQQLIESLTSGAAAAVPDSVQLEFFEKSGSSHLEFQRFDDFCVRNIARSVLIPDQLGVGAETKGGAWSKAKVHQDLLGWVAGDMDRDATEVVNESIIAPLCAPNFNLMSQEYPRFERKTRDVASAIETVKLFLDAARYGGFGPIRLEDVNYARNVTGWPEMSVEEWNERIAEDVPVVEGLPEVEREPAEDTTTRARVKPTEKGGGGKAGGGSEPGEAGTEPVKKEAALPEGAVVLSPVGHDEKRRARFYGSAWDGPRKGDVDWLSAVPGNTRPGGMSELAAGAYGLETPTRIERGLKDNEQTKRALTIAEKAVNLDIARINATHERIKEASVDEVVAAMQRAKHHLIRDLHAAGLLNGRADEATLYEFKGIDAKAKKMMADAMRRIVTTATVHGITHARNAIQTGAPRDIKLMTPAGGGTTPLYELFGEDVLIDFEEAMRYWGDLEIGSAAMKKAVEGKAFWIAGCYLDDHGMLLTSVKRIIGEAMHTHKWGAAQAAISGLFDEWVAEGKLVPAGQRYSAWHAELIVRNAHGFAFNTGNRMMLERARDWIDVMQWCSILDDRVTDFCEGMDGEVYPWGRIDPPPAHHLCRSIEIAVFHGIGHNPVDEDRLAELDAIRDPGFSGRLM